MAIVFNMKIFYFLIVYLIYHFIKLKIIIIIIIIHYQNIKKNKCCIHVS